MTATIPFDNSYARLPDAFHRATRPTPVAAPRLIALNRPLAAELGLDADALDGDAGAEIFAGNRVPPGANPIAAAYAGHQFGHFVPQLGDGRAILLGEIVDRSGARRDVQLKGAGPTPFSRRGDGRAALGPVLREYLVSEAMAALGVPTTRALAAALTGDDVLRETELPGAVLTRVAASHVRIGTFQYFAARQDVDSLRRLVDHVVARHYADAIARPDRALALLEGVIAAQARLVARWMLVGFVHGVMNTDNMAVSGETIDYGPCAFLDAYDPHAVFSSIDQQGRYAFVNQPVVARWNLTRLAECLAPLLSDDQDQAVALARAALERFDPQFDAAYIDGLRRKIGLSTEGDYDRVLIQDLLDRMAAGAADFTLTFRRLADAAEAASADAGVRELFADPTLYDDWAVRWRSRLAIEPQGADDRAARMRSVSPAVIPRNEHVEAVIAAGVERGDFEPFAAFGAALARPYDKRPADCRYAARPSAAGTPYRTFCGT